MVCTSIGITRAIGRPTSLRDGVPCESGRSFVGARYSDVASMRERLRRRMGRSMLGSGSCERTAESGLDLGSRYCTALVSSIAGLQIRRGRSTHLLHKEDKKLCG